MRHVTTANSVYEVNEAEHLIRRMHGANAPTPHQGVDGEWQQYEDMQPVGRALLIMWPGSHPDGTAKCTWTSDVILDDGEAWSETT